MNIRTLLIIGIVLSSISIASAQPSTHRDQVDEMEGFRLTQLRSGGVALLPISLTLTWPPGVKTPPFRWKQHLEQSMTEVLTKLRYDIHVTPPETTLSILNMSGGRTNALVQRDSLVLTRQVSTLIRERSGSRFIMGMSLASDWLPPALQKEYKQTNVDSIMVVCRIWDTQTGQVVWQTQHPWSIPAETESGQMQSRMRQLCAEIMAKIPQ